ncbi:DUF1553 domain-containing protein [Blastopirellula sp. JC732]|uniref:DUF1553 domain-containing protein n=1 Tax=Blastopirellula sediminis TaxID=2894196 RepID=A0A9X1MI31_9BACT|nr:DUF1553 domain-containing protein [Blastopirellula sediminis]MCC9608036.1 DUF1553 domain-containing protein [Blastopirellula sediminis]MCC9627171.1 DUF1553 domain-containing protein [Blastopirellula sediminis]
MRAIPPFLIALLLSPLLIGRPANVQAAEPDAEGIRFFETKIRPVLVAHCYECHSAKSETLRAGLLVDSNHGLLTGGDSGASIVPGKPDESLLLETLRYDPLSYQMPPNGKLSDAVIADFEKWIKMGAPDPRNDAPDTPVKQPFDIDSRRSFWSFVPPTAQPAPEVEQQAWPRQKIDAFVLAALEKAGLHPAAEADRRTLIRRVYFDLIGLPPTYDEIEQFAADPDPAAYEKLVDRLLASPHYGERWARRWLDVVRYGEDNVNMGPNNGPYPDAYRYRDWVVKAMNDDVPLDQFLRRQLATDFLEETGRDDLPALGLIGLSPENHKELKLKVATLEGIYADEWEDRVDVVSRGLMGLTVACARCHDHKYDPISSRDYYALAGVFASVRQTTQPIISDEEIAKTQPARDEIAALEKSVKENDDKIKSLKKDAPKSPEIGELETKNKQAKAKITEIRAATPGIDIPTAAAITDEQVRIEPLTEDEQQIVYYANKPRDLPVFIRGNLASPGEIEPRRFLEVLSDGEPAPFANGSGRLELAAAIADSNNPLTARVFVNRVWMYHFGEGLVDTPSNFGATGSRPTHPELLDDLAVRFMEQGWSTKKLHRELLLSATYRQSSQPADPEKSNLHDPGNRLLSRFRRQRLDAEAYHDALLVAGGNLNRTLGGPSGDIDKPDFDRRAIYAKISRKSLSQFLQVYDFPDPTIHSERRAETTTALQQLFVMNSPFAQQQARHLAERASGETLVEKIQDVHRLLLGREPTPEEIALGEAYVSESSQVDREKPETWEPPSFAGSRARAEIPSLGDIYSVELWFRNTMPHEERPIAGYFFSRGVETSVPSGGDHLGIMGRHQKDSSGRLIYYNGDRLKTALLGRTTLETNRWYHLVFTRQGSEVRLYLNGNADPEVSGVAEVDFPLKESSLFLGGRNDRFANFQGQLGSVAVYDRALAPKEIAEHYQRSENVGDRVQFAQHAAAMLKGNPVALWPFYEFEKFPQQIKSASGDKYAANYEGEGAADAEATRWVLYCHALFCSNELMFVD